MQYMIAIGVVLIAVGAGYLVYKHGAAIRQTIAGWNMPAFGNFAHWEKIYGTAAAMLAVFLIIYMFGWMFPKVSAAYYNKHDGWGYWLLLPIATFILPALIWPGRVRKILLWVLAVFVIGLILPALLPAIWDMVPSGNNPPSVQMTRVPEPDRRVARTVPTCPGTIETVVVGSRWVEINPGFRCAVVFDTKQGVALVGEPHNYVEDAPGIQIGNVMKSRGVKVIYAMAKFDQARIEYVLCPYGTTMPGKMACG